MTSADLDLRGLHEPHEPDPGFVDDLEQRLQAIVTDETTSTTDAPAVEDDPVVDLYASRNAERPAHRRWIIRTALGVAAAVLMAVIAAVILRDDEETPIGPPPTATAPADGWTPERTRAQGAPVDRLGGLQPSPSGLDAELYCVAEATPTGSPCPLSYPYEGPVEGWHWALEVTQGGQSALFEVRGTPIVTHFDDDSLLVHDGTTREARFRLLDADGSAVPLRLVSDLAPAVPGPEVVLIEDLDVWRHGSIGPDDPHPRPYLVDDSVGTLQPLDVPEEVLWWASNFDEFLWGGNDGCRVIWQQPDGTFDHHDIDCLEAEPNVYSFPEAAPIDPGPGLDDWLEPGRMVLVETSDDGVPLIVHASQDRGATWQRIEIEDRPWDGTTVQVAAAIADALPSLD